MSDSYQLWRVEAPRQRDLTFVLFHRQNERGNMFAFLNLQRCRSCYDLVRRMLYESEGPWRSMSCVTLITPKPAWCALVGGPKIPRLKPKIYIKYSTAHLKWSFNTSILFRFQKSLLFFFDVNNLSIFKVWLYTHIFSMTTIWLCSHGTNHNCWVLIV